MHSLGDGYASRAAQEVGLKNTSAANELLKSALAFALSGTWTWTVSTGQVTLSPEAYTVFGLDESTFDGTISSWLQYVCPEDRPRFPEIEKHVREGRRTFSFEYHFDSPLRGRKSLKSDGEVQLDESGQILRIVGTTLDLTQIRELRALGQDRLPLDTTEQTNERHWQQDAHFRYTAIAGRPLLRPAGTPIGLCRWELPNAVPLRSTWQEHMDVLQAHLAFTDFEYRAGDVHDPVYVAVSGVPVYDTQGNFAGYRGTARDITKRLRAEEEARRSRVLLEQASTLCRFGGWRLTLRDEVFTGTQETLALFGYTCTGPLPFDVVLGRFAPEWRTVLSAASKEPPERFEIEARATTVDGRPIWLRLVGEPERDPRGTLIALHGAVQDVTEQKQGADRLREVSSRLTATLESITDAFFTINREWCVTYANPEFERAMGVGRSQMLGRSLWELLPKSYGGPIHQQYARALDEGVTVKFEEYSSSLERWVRTTAYPSEQGLAVHFRDVTERKLARQALLESEERYRLLFETSLEAVLQTRPGGSITRANSAACRMFGMTEAEVCARGRTGLVAPGDARIGFFMAELDARGKAVGELTMLRADGTRFEAEVSGFRFSGSSGAVESAVVMRDITKQVLHEQELQALNGSLAERVRERTADLETANSELKAFAQSLAHDVRSPIAVIDAFSGELEEHLAGKEKHYASRIRAAARRLDEYVSALLSLARISRAKLTRTRVDLSDLAEAVVRELKARDPAQPWTSTSSPDYRQRETSDYSGLSFKTCLKTLGSSPAGRTPPSSLSQLTQTTTASSRIVCGTTERVLTRSTQKNCSGPSSDCIQTRSFPERALASRA